jgi:spore maturation protein CgeB
VERARIRFTVDAGPEPLVNRVLSRSGARLAISRPSDLVPVMNLCVFGLAISSSWGNGHATLWRGLCRELARMGHRVVFFERDTDYYARHRDSMAPDGCDLRLYRSWSEVRSQAAAAVRRADVAMVTSYCPDAPAASELVLESHTAVKAFYDLDTPVTLERLERGEPVEYVPSAGLAAFDLVLSYTGGRAPGELVRRLDARRVAPLYGSVDPDLHRPEPSHPAFAGHASYLGTYSPDRQAALDTLFLQPSRRMAEHTFVLGGSMYPDAISWPRNLRRIDHVPPAKHAAFYSSSRIAVNVTRGAMARLGYCPSGRLFESAACRVPVLSDRWDGLDRFFEPGREIFTAESTEEAMEVLAMPASELQRVGQAARERALGEHTARHRARQLVEIVAEVGSAS